ncbi:MAG: hypothetical protein EOO20_21015, partial [Chryseobacterium sp.]
MEKLKNKVIIITGESSSKYKTSCQQAGAVIYENKPTLRRVLEKAKVQTDVIFFTPLPFQVLTLRNKGAKQKIMATAATVDAGDH